MRDDDVRLVPADLPGDRVPKGEIRDDLGRRIARATGPHHLFHVLTGYGTDLAGEGLLIYFQIAYRQPTGFWRAALGVTDRTVRRDWERARLLLLIATVTHGL